MTREEVEASWGEQTQRLALFFGITAAGRPFVVRKHAGYKALYVMYVNTRRLEDRCLGKLMNVEVLGEGFKWWRKNGV